MTEGASVAPLSDTVSTISGPNPNPVPESEMDALLLGRTKVKYI